MPPVSSAPSPTRKRYTQRQALPILKARIDNMMYNGATPARNKTLMKTLTECDWSTKYVQWNLGAKRRAWLTKWLAGHLAE